MFDNLTTCKGFVLRTRPEDVAAGKRAKVLLGGMHMTGTNVNSMNLMFGRQPQAGEGGEIYMKMLEFYDIDFDCPMVWVRLQVIISLICFLMVWLYIWKVLW